MSTNFAILPEDILQTLSAQLDSAQNVAGGSNGGIEYLSLPHPRTGLLVLLFPTPDAILELQAVSPHAGRSWFLGDEVVSDGRLVMMTPIDAALLLIPILQRAQSDVYRTAEDIFEEATNSFAESLALTSPMLLQKSVDSFVSLPCTLRALRQLCDVKDFGPETIVYRYSAEKAKKYITAKINRLESSKSLDLSRTIVRNLAKDGLMEDGREKLLSLGRKKAAIDLVSQYLSPELKRDIVSSYDFTQLESYLKANMEEQVPLKSAANTKKGPGDATDKKRKAGRGSQGVEKLKKASTTGMSKLSSFFNKS
ncbi:hypothetical protein FA15DRAFT_688935 [Coprinopsis marcescibilis]|uniref:Ribonuclease H2 subunit B n=1 Tax=Coprinopsis marcescibilis TaxID=230819 RepID=A0A5C3KL61_COPMA|nr:hypothetical protein FA15DRAFT_688935 [Coprinopsis marcescibilis]